MEIIVFHDTVCPWCRIGKANLDRALTAWDGPAPRLRFWPFFLDPSVPRAPAPRPSFRERLAQRKGIDPPAVERMWSDVGRAGEACGLGFRFERIEHATNTVRSHRLIALAPEEHRPAVVDAIGRAYFEEGRDIDDPEVLADLAGEAGLDRAATADQLRGDAAHREVVEAARQAVEWGVSGVPLFVLDQRLALNGAQPPEALLDAMRRVTADAGRPVG